MNKYGAIALGAFFLLIASSILTTPVNIENAVVKVKKCNEGKGCTFTGTLSKGVLVSNSYKLAVSEVPFDVAEGTIINFVQFNTEWLIKSDGKNFEFEEARIWGVTEQ